MVAIMVASHGFKNDEGSILMPVNVYKKRTGKIHHFSWVNPRTVELATSTAMKTPYL